MKHKKQNQAAEEEFEQEQSDVQQDNGLNETTNGQYSEEDKEKGNLKKFEMSKKTIKKLKARNVEFLYPVQAESYTTIYEQKDCLIQASNGSGKTLAFVIPIVELLQSDKSVQLVPGRVPRALVVASTRDSSKKTSDEFQSIVNDLSIATIYGTKKKSDDQETAITNGCDILVATPDRLQEFINDEKVDLSQVKHVVFDEVDNMLESSVIENVKAVLKSIFTSDQETKPQLIVCSEAMPDAIRKLTKKYLTDDAVTVNISGKNAEAANGDDDDDEDDEGFEEEPTKGLSTKKSDKANGAVVSLLTQQESYTTYQLTTGEEIKSIGFVFTMLRKCLGDDFDAKGNVPKIAFTTDFKSAVFDLPSEYDEQLQSSWKDSARLQMGPITELPELDESSTYENSFPRGNNRSQRGGGGGGGNRNSGRSNACFNCGKEGHRSAECSEPKQNGGNRSGGGGGGGCFNCGKDGHKSFECPEPKKAGGRSGGGGGGGGCFNCGKDGHKSFECPEPKKAGGRPSGGAGGRSNACFNCGKEGHRSAECSEPRKAGGREQSNACFNCGKDGHKSFDCPEPKKGRPSFGGGGGRGGRGGGRGGSSGGAKRSFGGSYDNGHSAGEVVNKKIKFDDDD